MSESIEIFIKSNTSSLSSIKEIIEKISKVQALSFQYINRQCEGEEVQIYWNEDVNIQITNADGFDNDTNLNYEDYTHFISVEGTTPLNISRRNQMRNEYSILIFNELKKANIFDLLMVFNMQRKLDEYHPAINHLK